MAGTAQIETIPYYGGKQYQIEALLPVLYTSGRKHLVDVFGGSACVVLNAQRFKLRTYNDIDHRIVEFFTMLRDRGDELKEKLAQTPYSREEHRRAREPSDDPLESARRFYVGLRQSIIAQSFGSWSRKIDTGCSVKGWGNTTQKLDAICRGLLGVQIECYPFAKVIGDFDHEDVILYCDPPYLHETRNGATGYRNEMTREQHEEFLAAVTSVEHAAVLISGYRSALYDERLAGWQSADADFVAFSTEAGSDKRKAQRTETLWANYEIEQRPALFAVQED